MINKWIRPLWLREKVNAKISKNFKSVSNSDVPVEFNENIRMDLLMEDVGHRSIILNGFYDLPLTKTMLKLSAEGGILMDVGANYGYFSCLWASQNPINKVYAFEASPLNFGPLNNNILKNKLGSQISSSMMAIGREKGFLKFDLAKENEQTGWGGFSLEDKKGAIDVQVETLDNYALQNNISVIKVLKIDTEGADTWVLYGAENLLKQKKIHHIFFEENSYRRQLLKISATEAQKYLEKLNYIVKKTSESDYYAYPQQ